MPAEMLHNGRMFAPREGLQIPGPIVVAIYPLANLPNENEEGGFCKAQKFPVSLS
jgi:hypothetical protein